jgi:predicted DNA-binding protein
VHLCYLKQMKSRTSGFRISDELQVRLERTSRYLKRSKNWVISRALEGYLDQVGHDALVAEAGWK